MKSKTEKEKMLAGELYNAADEELFQDRLNARRLLAKFNSSKPDNFKERKSILKELFAKAVSNITIEPPFYCDYGKNIYPGENVYMNFNCIILDCNTVYIGENTLIGPNVQIYTAYHPIKAEDRIKGPELASAIKIGANVWIGGGAIILPGVTIGDNTTIGAGSVVTKNIPSNVIAAGNPCKIIREIS